MLVKIEKDEKGKCLSQSRKQIGEARKSCVEKMFWQSWKQIVKASVEKGNVFRKAENGLAKPEKVKKEMFLEKPEIDWQSQKKQKKRNVFRKAGIIFCKAKKVKKGIVFGETGIIFGKAEKSRKKV